MLNIFSQEMVPCITLNYDNCSEAKFSPAGEYFTICDGNKVRLFETYSAQESDFYDHIEGHDFRAKLQVWWYDSGKKFLTAVDKGRMYEWTTNKNS